MDFGEILNSNLCNESKYNLNLNVFWVASVCSCVFYLYVSTSLTSLFFFSRKDNNWQQQRAYVLFETKSRLTYNFKRKTTCANCIYNCPSSEIHTTCQLYKYIRKVFFIEMYSVMKVQCKRSVSSNTTWQKSLILKIVAWHFTTPKMVFFYPSYSGAVMLFWFLSLFMLKSSCLGTSIF